MVVVQAAKHAVGPPLVLPHYHSVPAPSPLAVQVCSFHQHLAPKTTHSPTRTPSNLSLVSWERQRHLIV